MRPEASSHPEYYKYYIGLLKAQTVLEAFHENTAYLQKTLTQLEGVDGHLSYAPNKWSIYQLLLHLADTERILSVRALRFARLDPQINPSFDEDHYAAVARNENLNLHQIQEEILAIRQSSYMQFKHYSTETLLRKGTTTMGETTVLALGYMICGHNTHHLNILHERYLKGL